MNKYIESETLELKEKYTDTICKEIVSFLNSTGGEILIGVKDNGTIVGVEKIDETLRKISDVITTQIEPNPQDEITSDLKFVDGKILIAINVPKGMRSIYCQKKYGFSSTGCTIRIGTTCREMTAEQIKIRYQKGIIDNEYMLKKQSSLQTLSFKDLKIYYSEKGFHIDNQSFETNLNLKNEEGKYNLLAELLSDKNNIPFIFVKFKGIDKTSISERNDYGHSCLLKTYEIIHNRLKSENTCISNTTTRPRIDKYLFNFDCVNEAILNALVHNDWTITEPQISIYSNRIEILSHGGLPYGMSKKSFFEGISRPRNATLMRIFLSMGLTEHTGHGVPTIVKEYGENSFEIEDTYIKCVIPFNDEVLSSIENVGIRNGINDGLTKMEKDVLFYLNQNPKDTLANLSLKLNVTKRTIERTISQLKEKNVIERIGSKKSGYWKIK